MSKLLNYFVLIICVSFYFASCCVKPDHFNPSKLLNILDVGAFFELNSKLVRRELLKEKEELHKTLLDAASNGSISRDLINQQRIQESRLEAKLEALNDKDKIIRLIREPIVTPVDIKTWIIGPRPLPDPCKCGELQMKEGLIILPSSLEIKEAFIEIDGTKIAESGPVIFNKELGFNVTRLKINDKYEGQEANLSLSYAVGGSIQKLETKVKLM